MIAGENMMDDGVIGIPNMIKNGTDVFFSAINSYTSVTERQLGPGFAAGYYQTELRPLRMRPNRRSTWYLGRNEYRGILEVVYDWHEQPSGIAVPGNVVSATWTPPMRERITK